MKGYKNKHMTPKNNTESLETKTPTTSETLKIGVIPETFEMPKNDERFLIGTESTTEDTEEPKAGFEVVSLAECARNEKGDITYEYPVTDSEGNTHLESVRLSGNTIALLVKNGETPDFVSGKGFKGLREGGFVTNDVIGERFGETEVSFSVGITEGKIIIENTRPETGLRVTTEKEATGVVPEAQASAPAVELEVSAERAEVSSELGAEVLDIIGVNEPSDEIDVETKPRPSITEMMNSETEPAPEAATEVVTAEESVVEATPTPEVGEQIVAPEAETELSTPEAATIEPTPEVETVESELGTASQELEVFETKMGETKTALEQLIGDQYDSFKDINKGLDELFIDKTGQDADLPSLLRYNISKLSTSIREIDSGHGDINTIREVASILGSVLQATAHFQGGNSALVTVPQLIEASNAKAHTLSGGMDDAAHTMSQSIGRLSQAVTIDKAASEDPGQYDVAIGQSRHDIMSLMSDIEDNDGPIVGARHFTSSIGNDLTTARSQYYAMSGLIDNVLGQIGNHGVDSTDLYAIHRIIGQFENTFEQLEQSKRALAGFIPQPPEQ